MKHTPLTLNLTDKAIERSPNFIEVENSSGKTVAFIPTNIDGYDVIANMIVDSCNALEGIENPKEWVESTGQTIKHFQVERDEANTISHQLRARVAALETALDNTLSIMLDSDGDPWLDIKGYLKGADRRVLKEAKSLLQ
jgi:hypothetical protein